jgi:hypothetical protein
MTTVNTFRLNIGSTVLVDGKERKVIAKSKAWKAPEYFVTLDGDVDFMLVSSRKMWNVVA